jgi:hypothetical protein
VAIESPEWPNRWTKTCHAPPVRIGTWNLAGRCGPAYREFLAAMDCDILLLTEVSECLELSGYVGHLTAAAMESGRRWAGVFSRAELVALSDPHPASAMAEVGDLTVCSSILPWRSCVSDATWGDGNHAAKTQRSIAALLERLPASHLVWGGDFNHALEGREYAGSIGGRGSVTAALETRGLAVPTARLPHQIDSILSIDHIAVPETWTVTSADRISASTQARRLSDHDAYVVEADF